MWSTSPSTRRTSRNSIKSSSSSSNYTRESSTTITSLIQTTQKLSSPVENSFTSPKDLKNLFAKSTAISSPLSSHLKVSKIYTTNSSPYSRSQSIRNYCKWSRFKGGMSWRCFRTSSNGNLSSCLKALNSPLQVSKCSGCRKSLTSRWKLRTKYPTQKSNCLKKIKRELPLAKLQVSCRILIRKQPKPSKLR